MCTLAGSFDSWSHDCWFESWWHLTHFRWPINHLHWILTQFQWPKTHFWLPLTTYDDLWLPVSHPSSDLWTHFWWPLSHYRWPLTHFRWSLTHFRLPWPTFVTSDTLAVTCHPLPGTTDIFPLTSDPILVTCNQPPVTSDPPPVTSTGLGSLPVVTFDPFPLVNLYPFPLTFEPTSSRLWHTSCDFWPTSGDLWPTFCDLWPTSGDLWNTCGNISPTSGDLWPTSSGDLMTHFRSPFNHFPLPFNHFGWDFDHTFGDLWPTARAWSRNFCPVPDKFKVWIFKRGHWSIVNFNVLKFLLICAKWAIFQYFSLKISKKYWNCEIYHFFRLKLWIFSQLSFVKGSGILTQI